MRQSSYETFERIEVATLWMLLVAITSAILFYETANYHRAISWGVAAGTLKFVATRFHRNFFRWLKVD